MLIILPQRDMGSGSAKPTYRRAIRHGPSPYWRREDSFQSDIGTGTLKNVTHRSHNNLLTSVIYTDWLIVLKFFSKYPHSSVSEVVVCGIIHADPTFAVEGTSRDSF